MQIDFGLDSKLIIILRIITSKFSEQKEGKRLKAKLHF